MKFMKTGNNNMKTGISENPYFGGYIKMCVYILAYFFRNCVGVSPVI